jgi:hypothetical protein
MVSDLKNINCRTSAKPKAISDKFYGCQPASNMLIGEAAMSPNDVPH